jgi:hypothetical protein
VVVEQLLFQHYRISVTKAYEPCDKINHKKTLVKLVFGNSCGYIFSITTWYFMRRSIISWHPGQHARLCDMLVYRLHYNIRTESKRLSYKYSTLPSAAVAAAAAVVRTEKLTQIRSVVRILKRD